MCNNYMQTYLCPSTCLSWIQSWQNIVAEICPIKQQSIQAGCEPIVSAAHKWISRMAEEQYKEALMSCYWNFILPQRDKGHTQWFLRISREQIWIASLRGWLRGPVRLYLLSQIDSSAVWQIFAWYFFHVQYNFLTPKLPFARGRVYIWCSMQSSANILLSE